MRLGLWVAVSALVGFNGCANDGDAHLYRTQPIAPSFNAADVAALNHLGPTLVDKGVNFGVYSQHATKVQLALFDDPDSSKVTRQFDMVRQGDVWNLYVEGVGINQAYGYIAWGPNWPYDPNFYPGSIYGFLEDVDSDGNRFDPNKLLMDPYAKADHRDFDWSKGSTATGPDRTVSTYAAESKSLVVQSTYQWSANETQWRQMRQDPNAPGHRWNDLVIYETHPKGFTMDPASGVRHPGTYRGIGEKASYLADLGVNAVELMPVMEKPIDGGYWGYQTIGFFFPERAYAYDKLLNHPTEEFKWMVDQLHQNGIEVILDVVYNHTGEGGLWRQKIQQDDIDPSGAVNLYNFDPKEVAGIYSFRGLDNQNYYALDPTNKGLYWDNTGVGDDSLDNGVAMRRLIVDSLHYWSQEMHIDGFRFDLAPILGEKPDNYYVQDDPANTVLQDIIDDPILQQYNTRIMAEPWSLSAFMVGGFPSSSTKDGTGWGEWNGPFRDWWRSFVNNVPDGNKNNEPWKLNSLDNNESFGGLMLGSSNYYQWNNRRPYHSTNFVTIHDGFTMYDVFTYPQKVNGCGPLNPICCTNPLSAFCDFDSGETNNRSLDWSQFVPSGLSADASDAYANMLRRRQMRDLFAAMLLANGTPLLLGGDEWERTQLGNNNAYSDGADNAYNWYAWGEWEADNNRVRMHDFVKKLIHFRNAHTYALAPDQYGPVPIWMREDGQVMGDGDWERQHIAVYYRDVTGGPALYLIFNMESSWVNFNLPTDHSWNLVADTQTYFDNDDYFSANPVDPTVSQNINIDNPPPVPGTSYNVPDHSVVILEAAD
jgi:glycogen operon protein